MWGNSYRSSGIYVHKSRLDATLVSVIYGHVVTMKYLVLSTANGSQAVKFVYFMYKLVGRNL